MSKIEITQAEYCTFAQLIKNFTIISIVGGFYIVEANTELLEKYGYFIN